LIIWDITKFTIICSKPLKNIATFIKISPDEKYFIIGFIDGDVQFLDAISDKNLPTYNPSLQEKDLIELNVYNQPILTIQLSDN
jgi:hypothetical protein